MTSEGTEHLSSVHNNPFIRQFGLPHHARAEGDETSTPSSVASSEKGDDDAEQEYHVNSGFVNKLRSKFAQLENKSSKITLSKKSASVENLLSIGQGSSNDYSLKSRNRFGSAGRSSDDTPVTTSSKATLRHFAPTGYKPQIRPRSNELEKSSVKPPLASRKEVEKLKQNNTIRSVKRPLPKKTSIDTTKRYSRNSSSELKPKPEHHDWKVAPDVEKIARDNLVIIESNDKQTVSSDQVRKSEKRDKKREKEKRDSNSDLQDIIGRVKPVSDKEKISDENELPKPNTVSNFRTLFEKTNKNKRALDTLSAWRSHHSPTRRSSGSDTNSPQMLSPVSTPRSPLVKVTNDNVFENSYKAPEWEFDKPVTPREDPEPRLESSPVTSPRILDNSENIDTSSSSMQQMLEKFRQASEERDTISEKRRSISPDRFKSSKSEFGSAQNPSVQHTLTPVHPVSKVFDSKLLIKPEKVKRPKPPKPTVYERKGFVPKDMIELKHEADEKRRSLSEDQVEEINIHVGEKEDEVFNTDNNRNSAEINFSYDSNIKPSMKTEKDNLSPRQTNIFDSSRIIKKKRDPPKLSSSSPVESPTNIELTNNVPNRVSIEIKDGGDVQEDIEISPVKPSRKPVESNTNNGLTEIKTNIIKNDTNGESENKNKSRRFKVSDQMFPKLDSNTSRPEPVRNQATPDDNKDSPVSGMSSFLASRLKKSQPDQQENQLKTSSNHLANGSSPSPVLRKRKAPEIPGINGSIEVEVVENKPAPPLPTTPEPSIVSIKPKKSQPKATKGKMVFDSSKIVTKRKEPPKRKPPRKTVGELNQNITFDIVDSAKSVPKLDLSCITDDKQATEYQEGYIPTVIQPCPFKFLGAEVTFPKSPFKRTKTKQAKVKISFNDHATTTFEYEGEESALQNYLMDHPDEKDDVVKQDEELNGDVETTTEELLHDSPRAPVEPETHMKSNTIIGHNPGALTSYKSKMQTQDFQFGMSTAEPEIEYNPDIETTDDPESFQLLPAAENDVDAFSAETDKSDMLF